MEFTTKQIADFLHGRVEGDETIRLSDFAKIEAGRPNALSFLSNLKYEHYLYTTRAGAVLVDEAFKPEHPVTVTLIRVKNAYEALATLLRLVDSARPRKTGIHPTAVISPSAKVGDEAFIGAYAVIGDNAVIGRQVTIEPHTVLGDNVTIGNNTLLHANVTVYNDCRIGARCIIHSGAIIGADGFGFAPDREGRYNKIPQLGNVVIEDDIEIGANTTVDRAVIGSTTIHQGSKLDNLCQVAHNVQIGEHTAIAAQSGIAGSTKVGSHCVFAGQVGIVGHVEVPDGTIFAAKTGISGNVRHAGTYAGYPQQPIADFRRSSVLIRKLGDMYDRINELEKSINSIKNR